MTIEQRKRKLAEAKVMVTATLKRVRRLNTALKNWERRVKMHEKALTEQEKEELQKRIRELEMPITRARRQIEV